MTDTTVIEIVTDKDLEIFCKRLKQAKKKAPKSLTFTVAITFDRKVSFRTLKRKLKDTFIDPVWSRFNAQRRKRR
jgi:hypothetical protein